MMQTASLLQTLKHCLKAQRKTYADVAQALGLSEASVKRMFSEQQFSLERLDRVCDMLGMEISDLVKLMETSRARIERLTHSQESEIIQDIALILVTVCVFNHWTMKNITQYFTLSEEECVLKLLKLDKIGIIQLLPQNRIKLLISPNFSWIENGPFERFFREHVGQEYFNGSFSGEHRFLRVLNGALSTASAAEFQHKLLRLAREFSEISREESTLPIENRDGVTLVIAMRNWDYGFFDHLVRPEYKLKS
ncbi:MAG: helix-turn-helix transcriptional regulator [Rhodospirillales bacterium]|nr:helix-turn-helix transcriptional regulator [Alphaproteobacteria bacterium]MCB9976948.1 helix-turn-helix transcriptional regulator [Rhodospirillales bacterium]